MLRTSAIMVLLAMTQVTDASLAVTQLNAKYTGHPTRSLAQLKSLSKNEKNNQIAQIASQNRLEHRAKSEAKNAEKQAMVDQAVSQAMAEHAASATADSTAKADWESFKNAKGGAVLAQTASKKYADVLAETKSMADAKAEADA